MRFNTFGAICAGPALLLSAALASAERRYVSLEGAHQPPFTTWATAAKDIRSAIDASSAEDEIVVARGTYEVQATIHLNKPLTVRSQSGARHAILDGGHGPKSTQGVSITATPAIFDGFTITHFDEGVRFAHGEGTSSILRNCVVVHNGGHGIYFNHGGCAKNCTVAYNGGAGLYAYDMGGGGDDPDNMILFGNAQPFVRQSANIGLENSYTDDPHFVSEKDLRLRADSPCIDAGRNEPWMSDAIDASGRRRIQNGVVDIGAYEHRATKDRNRKGP